MIKVRTNKMKETLIRLIEHIWNSCLIHDTILFKISIQHNQYFANIIQAYNFDWDWLGWMTNKALGNLKKKDKSFFPNLF